MRLSGGDAGEAGGGRPAGSDCLRRRGAPSAPAASVFLGILRHGGLCAGAGAAYRKRHTGGQRHILHQCGRQGAGHCLRGSVCGFDGGLSDGGKTRGGRKALAGTGLHWGPDCGADSPLGQRQQPSGAGRGPACAGDSPRRAGRRPSQGDPQPTDAPGPASPGSPVRAAAQGGPVPAAPALAISCGGHAGGTAAGYPDRLDGNCGKTISGPDGGAVAHGPGNRLYRPLGRGGKKGGMAQ